jgi:C-terminal processing protease CtpA/Prc
MGRTKPMLQMKTFHALFLTRFLVVGIVFSLLVAFPFHLSAQHPDNYFEPKDMQKDLSWLQRKVLQYHPVCVDSIRYDSVRLAFEEALYEAEKPLQELQFLRLLRKTLNSLRCGHTTAIPSTDFYNYYQNAKPKPFFPLQILKNQAGMFVRFNGSNDGTISVGDRLLTINQESTEQISEDILDFLPGDGYHKTFRQFHLSLNFPTYYLFLKGPSYSFESGLVDTSGQFSTHVFSLRSQGKPVSKSFRPKSTRLILADRNRELTVLTSNSEIGCLKIYGFGGSDNWYRSAFKEIEKRKIKMLVLDLRGNSGGNLFSANQLLTYLLPDTFSMCFKRRDGKIHLNRRSNMSLGMRLSMFQFRNLRSREKGLRPTCQLENEILINRFRFEPVEKHGFKGKLVVLMDGGTFSAATMVAAQLRKKMHVKLLGEESGGGAKGTNAMIMPTLKLRKTRMRVTLPLFYLDHEMGDIPFRGLIPDYKLLPDVNLKVKGVDSELEFLAKTLPFMK